MFSSPFRSRFLPALAALASVAPGCASLKAAKPLKPSFEIQGHRGARAERPENTLAGFRHALEAGADVLELDLLVTKDNQLVLGHDPVLNPEICLAPGGKPLGAKPIVVRKLTLREIQAYDCGTLVNPNFPRQVVQPGARMPSFTEFLDWLAKETHPRAKTVGLNVELKIDEKVPANTAPPQLFAKLLLEAIKRGGVAGRTTIQSFSFPTLLFVRKMDPIVRTAVLLETRPSKLPVQTMASMQAQIYSISLRWLTQRDVLALHKSGYKVVPWTANTEEEWRRLADYGVDGIITDDPAGLAAFRARWVKGD